MKPVTALMALIALGASLLSVVPAATAASASASEVTVAWPEATRFNPTTYSYEVAVTNSGDGHLFYTAGPVGWQTPVYPLPDSGQIDLSDGGRALVVRIWSCTTEQWSNGPECSLIATSPKLDVASRLQVSPSIWVDDPIGPGPVTVALTYWPKARATEIPSATWELVDANGQSVDPVTAGAVSSTTLAAAGPDHAGEFTVVVPKTVPSGRYHLDVHMSLSTTDFGPLEGSSEPTWTEFDLDTDPPRLEVEDLPTRFYPVRDHYRDVLAFTASNDAYDRVTFQVINKAGAEMYRQRPTVDPDGTEIDWDGQDSRHRIVPAGNYTLKLRAADRVGNTSVWSAPISVSRKRLVWKDFKRTVTAAGSRVGKSFVGRCARLSSPASGGPRGSLGYYSDAGCHGNDNAHSVVTSHGMYIPQAFDDRYRWARVTLNGGPASRSASNYIVLIYQTPPNSTYSYRTVFREGHGAHQGGLLWPEDFFDRTTAHPYIIWTNGLTAGSRYDVRSYTVRVRYRVLR